MSITPKFKNRNIFPQTLYIPVKWINARILPGSFLLVLALSASSQNKQESSTLLPPVETQAPISKGQKSAFRVRQELEA